VLLAKRAWDEYTDVQNQKNDEPVSAGHDGHRSSSVTIFPVDPASGLGSPFHEDGILRAAPTVCLLGGHLLATIPSFCCGLEPKLGPWSSHAGGDSITARPGFVEDPASKDFLKRPTAPRRSK
jgi:hypothetical protein